MIQVETVMGILVLRDSEIVGVRASVRETNGVRWLTFPAPPGAVWLGNVVEMVVVEPRPRVISAAVVSRAMPDAGARVERFEAVIRSEHPSRTAARLSRA